MKLEIKFLNSIRFTKLLIAASRWLSKYSDVLNDLNVYPVPDGDTGTNMSMTLQSVENELIKLDHKIDMEELVELVSDSVILGARGNSGIILSQFIQGFLKGIKGKEEVTIADVAKGFDLDFLPHCFQPYMLNPINTTYNAACAYIPRVKSTPSQSMLHKPHTRNPYLFCLLFRYVPNIVTKVNNHVKIVNVFIFPPKTP